MNFVPLIHALLVSLICFSPMRSSCGENKSNSSLTFCCSAENDLFKALKKQSRFETPRAAVENAKPNSAVLILADGYPEKMTHVTAEEFAMAKEKNLRLFIEYPEFIPGFELGSLHNTEWERGVVASDRFGTALPAMRTLAAHGCRYISATAKDPWLVIARVAGYDTAVYGLPKNAAPLLFETPERKIFVATTKLSGFVTARFAPAQDWQLIWTKILEHLQDRPGEPFKKIEPAVRPAFQATEKLPRQFGKRAFDSAAQWVFKSRLLIHPSRRAGIETALAANVETTNTPSVTAPIGDGSLGILEGFASGISHDGNQLQRLPIRADCQAETAMVLALDAALNRDQRSRSTAKNLLDYVYFDSEMCRGPRGDPKHGAYGLISWGAISPAWMVANYGDDNARVLLSTIVSAASLRDGRWDESVMRGLLANLRTTGKLGFRTDRIDVPALGQNGWKPYHDGSPVDYSPHFESYLWACNLWAFRETGYRPFFNKSTNAIAMTMKAYPAGWRWRDNIERARMLLCLSWLVRLEDTAEHREWLNRVANDLLTSQGNSGAIHEKLAGTGGGHYQIPQSNEAYGTGETPLIQTNGDPASDQLYTTGFALLGLHEAVGATGDKKLRDAENRLAEFLCRIQIRSKQFPYLDGTWFRAFDDHRWEFWASSADIGWGAWSIEAGWGQAWTAAILGLREKKTTVWDLTKGSGIAQHFEKTRIAMELEK